MAKKIHCPLCGQPSTVHNQEYCDAVVKVFSVPARRIEPEGLKAFRKLGEPNGGKRA